MTGEAVAGFADVQVARQPISDTRLQVWAYELLFRSGVPGVVADDDPETATAGVVSNSLFVIGVDDLTGGVRGFINVPNVALLEKYAGLLSPDRIGIEVLGSVSADDDAVVALRNLKQGGFVVVLDDYVVDDERAPLLPFVDVVKVDYLSTEPEQRREITDLLLGHRVAVAGKRIETQEAFDEARDLGWSFFQGYFFAEPKIVPGREVPSSKLTYMRILREIN